MNAPTVHRRTKEKNVSQVGTGTSSTESVDVVIIGAGFAGLTAADGLVSKGRSVVVLEGRDRVGGRSMSGEVAGVTVDATPRSAPWQSAWGARSFPSSTRAATSC
jgi:monoamine oxidase